MSARSMNHYHFIATTLLALGVATSSAQELKNTIPRNQKPILRVFPPSPAEQSKPGTGKFVIFTREQLGTNWDFIAGAWECIPSHPETPITKRIEFCHSSWNADALLNTLVPEENKGMHPRFVSLQVDSGDRDYAVNLYDINYRTWDARCLWQGRRLGAFGLMGKDIFCNSPDGWLLLDTATGKINRSVPFTPIETDGNYWLVRKPGETEGCWTYDRQKKLFIARFGPVEKLEVGFSRSWLSPDGKSRAWALAPMPQGWRGGTIEGRLILQRPSGHAEITVPIAMQARLGRGVPVIPIDIQCKFSPDGQVEFSARKGKNDTKDQVWSIDIASGNVSSTVRPHLAAVDNESAVLDEVPVPAYLRKYIGALSHFGRSGLAPAFLLQLGLLKEQPEYPDCTAGVSRDGRHVLYAAKKGPLAGFFIYGDLLTKQTLRWKSPAGLDYREAEEFIWVETPD